MKLVNEGDIVGFGCCEELCKDQNFEKPPLIFTVLKKTNEPPTNVCVRIYLLIFKMELLVNRIVIKIIFLLIKYIFFYFINNICYINNIVLNRWILNIARKQKKIFKPWQLRFAFEKNITLGHNSGFLRSTKILIPASDSTPKNLLRAVFTLIPTYTYSNWDTDMFRNVTLTRNAP